MNGWIIIVPCRICRENIQSQRICYMGIELCSLRVLNFGIDIEWAARRWRHRRQIIIDYAHTIAAHINRAHHGTHDAHKVSSSRDDLMGRSVVECKNARTLIARLVVTLSLMRMDQTAHRHTSTHTDNWNKITKRSSERCREEKIDNDKWVSEWVSVESVTQINSQSI